jgi:hypothetical protein
MDKQRRAKRQRTKRERQLAPGRAGWSIPEYFPNVVGFGGRTSFYALPDDAKPRHIRVGRTVVIIEPPADYLRRLEEISVRQPIEFRRAA